MVERIAQDDRCLWVGLGDYGDFINLRDPRFSVHTLAPWMITAKSMGDIAGAQRDRLLDLLTPIAPKCLALLEGNHETAIARHYERNIFSEIVTGLKKAAGHAEDYPLALGYYGWLQLVYHRSEGKSATTLVNVNLHHGFGGGKLEGGKALNMQRWLWTHGADIVIMGHTHSGPIQNAHVETIDRNGKVRVVRRRGANSGTFLRGTIEDGPPTYSEQAGYLPLDTSHVEIILRPGAENADERIRIMS